MDPSAQTDHPNLGPFHNKIPGKILPKSPPNIIKWKDSDFITKKKCRKNAKSSQKLNVNDKIRILKCVKYSEKFRKQIKIGQRK